MTDDGTVSDLALGDVLASAAEGLVGVAAQVSPESTTWRVGPAAFAILTADVAEFRLEPLVAAAALRTSDTAPSGRGPDWVSFAPGALEDQAVDRAEAWFLSAYRRAASPPRR